MQSETMAVLGGTLLTIVLLGLGTALLAWLALAAFRGEALVYEGGVRRCLKAVRGPRFEDRGLKLRWRLLHQLTSEEAMHIVSAGSGAVRDVPRWGLDLDRRIDATFRDPDQFADFEEADREALRMQLHALAERERRRWAWVLLIVVAAVAIVLSVSLRHRLPLLDAVRDNGTLWVASATAFIAAACTALGWLALKLWAVKAASADRPTPPPSRTVAPPPDLPRIGREGQPIRAINFSSGGFDTMMHLGVIHALIVIQGRAPDAVVGLSAGAIQAAALAQILQSGDEAERKFLDGRTWSQLLPGEKAELQQLRLLARVERLRHFIEAAQRAPERLLDAVLPDAYQIDVGRPLQPLQQPRFSQPERRERGEFVIARSGLARLYNDLMNVPLTIATLAKVARRVLGLVATAEILSMPRRWVVRAIEVMRLWILLGANLLPAAKIARIAMRPFLPQARVDTQTAGALIFRSRLMRGFTRVLFYGTCFIFFFMGWTLFSVATLPFFALATVVAVMMPAAADGSPYLKSAKHDGLQGIVVLLGLTLGALGAIAAFVLLVEGSGPFAMLLERPGPALWDGWLSALVAALAIAALAAVPYWWSRSDPRSYPERFLASYHLGDALLREHGLRSFLAELFDRNFYRKPGMNRVVEAALDNEVSCELDHEDAAAQRAPKRLADFCDTQARLPHERIHVGIAVASTENGALHVVPPQTPVVEALMAATAVTPWFRPVELERTDKTGRVRRILYIDGANVTQEPTHALLKLMREYREPNAGQLHIYSVAPFPLSKPELGEALPDGRAEDLGAPAEAAGVRNGRGRRYRPYLDLVDIVWRALRLRRFRDAAFERRLTELYTETIPESQPAFDVPRGVGDGGGARDTYFRAWVAPVELEYDADLNRRLYRAPKEDRRRIIEESIADGCRAALQVMIPDAIERTRERTRERAGTGGRATVARCAAAVRSHLAASGLEHEVRTVRLPGSGRLGPGLSEICSRCCLGRNPVAAGRAAAPAPERLSQRLKLDAWEVTGPSWPHERQLDEPAIQANKRFRRPEPPHRAEMRAAWEAYAQRRPPERQWPKSRSDGHGVSRPGNTRPTISLLFSGGVFRGVYQVGVLNGLHELGVRPDLIAGASVGSITAAMIAEALSLSTPAERSARIARLAAVYLAVDRLILTDRFADFVRSLTLRAAQTRFSIRQADRVFRKYDYPTFFELDRIARRVVAGIERLFYLSPYRLNELVRAFRGRDSQAVLRLLGSSVQHFLDRLQIGDEALGAEALRELIEYYVVGARPAKHPVGLTTDELRESHGLVFLATATNLTRGRLEILGEAPDRPRSRAPVLVESLLASSAFPGVFRPRWSWEVMPDARQVHQFIDGGVMDNLPIDAIAAFLHRAAGVGLIERVPQAPHLIIGASLEVRTPSYALAFTRNRFRTSWIALRNRAVQLGYNTKLDTYELAEHALRRIHEHARRRHPDDSNVKDSALVGIQLLAIKPEWLSGTFAFHPMLGFRRRKQARSIAHGCATTLLEFARLRKAAGHEGTYHHLEAWGIDPVAIPKATTWTEAFKGSSREHAVEAGHCWLRGVPCPFSERSLSENDQALLRLDNPAERPLGATLIREISQIHRYCVRPETHMRRI